MSSDDRNPMRCICEFPATCGGSGTLTCNGCGGDLCVCRACFGQGAEQCDGCKDCANDDDWRDP